MAHLSPDQQFRFQSRYPFHEGSKNFPHPESHSKISSLMITELFYSHIFVIMNRGFFHTRSFRWLHLTIFTYRFIKNGFVVLNYFQGFLEMGPTLRTLHCVLRQGTLLSQCLLGVTCIPSRGSGNAPSRFMLQKLG